MKLDLPYLMPGFDRTGRQRMRVRIAGRTKEIKAVPGTQEFLAAYTEAVELLRAARGGRLKPQVEKIKGVKLGTMRWFATKYFGAPDGLLNRNAREQRVRRNIIESCL